MTDPAAATVLQSVQRAAQQDLRTRALALAADGRYPEAIAAATSHNRGCRDDELERLLVNWRMSAFTTSSVADPLPPRDFEDPFPGISGLPEIHAEQLTTDILAGAILHHGALLVRGLISADEAGKFRPGIDRALGDFSAWLANQALPPTRWFAPVDASSCTGLGKKRPSIHGNGSVLAADSPRLLFELVALIERIGVIDIVSDYLQERPALSVNKTTLRKISASQKNTGWHQDGAFLGKEVRSVNLWLALSPCGRDAPGLDLVPKRIPYIVETGTQGALMDWLVGPGVVKSLAQDAPVLSPEFAAGDALMFDHLFLHRTGLPPGRNKDRYAIECWMFAPSCFPVQQGPLML